MPNGLHPTEIPQIVLLTFSGPVHSLTINIFKSLFNGRFRLVIVYDIGIQIGDSL